MSGNVFHVHSIVEGYGEVEAVSVLLRRIYDEFKPSMFINPHSPFRVKREQFINCEDKRRKYLGYARHYASKKGGGVLILLDAEEECCQEQLKNEMKDVRSDIAEILKGIPHLFVLAEKGYESWIVAGMGGEWKCSGSPKEWLKNHPEAELSGKYSEPIDQPKVTANPKFNIKKAMEKNKSFRRFVKRILKLPTKVNGGGK